MKVMVQFGRIDGHTGGVECFSAKQAKTLCFQLAHVFGRPRAENIDWSMSKAKPTMEWRDSTYFVRFTVTDFNNAGPNYATTALRAKEKQRQT